MIARREPIATSSVTRSPRSARVLAPGIWSRIVPGATSADVRERSRGSSCRPADFSVRSAVATSGAPVTVGTVTRSGMSATAATAAAASTTPSASAQTGTIRCWTKTTSRTAGAAVLSPRARIDSVRESSSPARRGRRGRSMMSTARV